MLIVSLTVAKERALRAEADRLHKIGSLADRDRLAIWPQRNFNLPSQTNQPTIPGVFNHTSGPDTNLDSNRQGIGTGGASDVEMILLE